MSYTILNVTVIKASGSPVSTQVRGKDAPTAWQAAREFVQHEIDSGLNVYSGAPIRVFAHDNATAETEEWTPARFAAGQGNALRTFQAPVIPECRP
jgi:hypothetical protein